MFNGAILQQAFSVEYVVADQPCTDCNRHAANPNVWVAAVQVWNKGCCPSLLIALYMAALYSAGHCLSWCRHDGMR